MQGLQGKSVITSKYNGWASPMFAPPIITRLSHYYSPAATASLVTIDGQNFATTSTVHMDKYTPAVLFVSSARISFYVPESLGYGVHDIFVSNAGKMSNGVRYHIDNSSGFWRLNPMMSISNTNVSGICVTGACKIDGDIVITEPTQAIVFGDKSEQASSAATVGEIVLYAGAELPANFLWCDGQSMQCVHYEHLFSVIGHSYTPVHDNNGDDFCVPDLTGQSPSPKIRHIIRFKT